MPVPRQHAPQPRTADASVWARALLAWLALMAAETVHGTLRALLLAPRVGDVPARRIAVFTGSALVVALTWLLTPWLRPGRRTARLLAIGVAWAVLTVAFEVLLGRLAFGLPWSRIAADYDLPHGGLMPLGLVVLALAPFIATRTRAGGPT